MPPKRAKAKEAAPNAAPTVAAPTVATLLARCSRGDLERLIEESVRNCDPVTYDKVRAALPEAKQAGVIARPQVAVGQTRENTGWFDTLDDELLIAIFLHVHSTATRVGSAIAVCKAWRGVLKCAELFTSLDLSASRYSGYYSTCLPMSSSNLPRLIKWLPDVTTVTSLRINTGDKHQSISPDAAKKGLPLFTGLTDLVISGKKTTAALFAVLAKQAYCANLTHFEMGDCSAKPEDALPVLVSATRLTSLKVNLGFGGDCGQFLRSLASGWRAKRGGDATPLLTTFETTGWSGCKLDLSTFLSLADQFPELSSLRTGLRTSYLNAPIMPTEIISKLPPMERLRELSLSGLIHSYGAEHLSSERLNNVLCIICQVAPNLTYLKVHHGTMYVSGKEQRNGKRVEPHPSPNGALGLLPATLETLDLGTMVLGTSDFDTASLGALQHLTLNTCGPHAAALASVLCERCPLLELKRCFASETKQSGPYGGFRLVCLDPHEEGKRKEAEAAAQAARSQGRSIPIQGTAGAPGTSASGAADSPETGADDGFDAMDEEEVNMANRNDDDAE